MKTKILLLCGLLLATISCKKDKPLTAPQAGLISYFNFDDNFKDQKGYASDGVPTGNPTFTAGKIGKALTLNGTSQYVDFTANPAQSPNEITVAYWLKPNQIIDGFNRFILKMSDSNPGGCGLVWNKNNVIIVGLLNSPINPQSTLTPNEWRHVAITYNGNDLNLYINGVLKDTKVVIDGKSSAYFTSLSLGSFPGYNYYLQGSIDELYIYNRALSPAEVTQLYNLK